MVSPVMRAVSATSTASAALVAAVASISWPDPAKATFLALVVFLAVLSITGHSLAGTIANTISRSAIRLSGTALRGIFAGLSSVAALVVLFASAPYVGSPERSIVLALLTAAAVHSFGCFMPNDLITNGLLGAGAVGMAILFGAPLAWVIPPGLLWATAFAAQLAMTHRHELATKISHPEGLDSSSNAAVSDEPWTRTISVGLAALVVLALMAALIPPFKLAIGSLGEKGSGNSGSSHTGPAPSGDRSTPRDPRSTSNPGDRAKGSPQPDRNSPADAPSDGPESSPRTRRGEVPGGQPAYGLDLDRVEEPGNSEVFAVVNAPEPHLMRASVFAIYTGHSFLAPSDPGARLGKCPCTLPVGRDASVPFDNLDQHVEIVAAYDGPLPAAFEARQIKFSNLDPTTSVALAEGGVLIPAGPVKTGTAYTVSSQIPRQDPTRLLQLDEPVPTDIASEYLQLPYGYSDRVRDLASEITGREQTPYGKATAITGYVIQRHRHSDGRVPQDNKRDAVERYLFDENSRGLGDDAVVASVVMMRTVGIPARVGFGYRPRSMGQTTPVPTTPSTAPANQIFWIDKSMRTTWVEYYVAGYGWVTADIQPLLGLNPPPKDNSKRLLIAALFATLAVVVLTIAALLWRRSKKRRRAAGESEAHSLMRMLEQAVGIERKPSQTPSEYGAVLWARLPNADRELAMVVIGAIIQLSYTRDPLGDAQRIRVRDALRELRSRRKEREQRGRHRQTTLRTAAQG
jgi:hypothetical protein